MHKSTSGNELVCSKHQDFCRADSRAATGGSWGRGSLVPKKVGGFLMKVGRRGSWQPGMCLWPFASANRRLVGAPDSSSCDAWNKRKHPFQCFACVSPRAGDGSNLVRLHCDHIQRGNAAHNRCRTTQVPSRLESWAAPKQHAPAHWRIRPDIVGSQVWILGLGILSNIRVRWKDIPRTGDCPMGSIPPAKIVQETDLIPTAYARSSFLHLSASWRFRLSINRFWPLTSKCF